jgi:hypothetical protein
MYIKMSEEEDSKLAHRWQKDADGILIFVSPLPRFYALRVVTNVKIVDWFIFCGHFSFGRADDSGLEAKSTGYLSILSEEHLSATRRFKHISCIDPCHFS